jgi:hypothetical protein
MAANQYLSTDPFDGFRVYGTDGDASGASGGGLSTDPSGQYPTPPTTGVPTSEGPGGLSGQNQTGTGGGPSTSTLPTFTAGMTSDQVRAAIQQYFAARGVTPNPTSVDYWVQKWSEFGNSDPNYFTTRLSQADEFGGGSGGSGGYGGYGGGGSYGGLWNQAPTLEQLQNMPGFQFAMDEGRKNLENSAAARGTLLTGGTLKDISTYGTNMALNQAFFPYWSALNASNNANFNNLYNLGLLGYNASSYGPRSPV